MIGCLCYIILSGGSMCIEAHLYKTNQSKYTDTGTHTYISVSAFKKGVQSYTLVIQTRRHEIDFHFLVYTVSIT